MSSEEAIMVGGHIDHPGITSINKIPTPKSPRKTLSGYEHHRKMYTIQIDKGETDSLHPICHLLPVFLQGMLHPLTQRAEPLSLKIHFPELGRGKNQQKTCWK